MKIAVSIPDRIFHAAEHHARGANKSRSQLYGDALAEYLNRHAPDAVTEVMNRVADQMDTGAERLVRAAASGSLARSEW